MGSESDLVGAVSGGKKEATIVSSLLAKLQNFTRTQVRALVSLVSKVLLKSCKFMVACSSLVLRLIYNIHIAARE
jgi:hypothetical protein